MNMDRRLSKIEEKLKTSERYKDCELEIHVGVDDEPTKYFCRYPDGHCELITDNHIVNELADIPGDEITVEVVD